MPFEIVREDITKMKVDAIVNAANTGLRMGGGVCGAIFAAAGATELQEACGKLAPVATGEAAITPGFNLPAKFVIHTPGPVWQGGTSGEEEMLKSCYINSLRIAEENGCESVAFPLISSGIYGYPKKDALKVATRAITDFIAEHDINVYLALFDTEALSVSEKLIFEIMKGAPAMSTGWPTILSAVLGGLLAPRGAKKTPARLGVPKSLGYLIGHLDESFTRTLFRLIEAKGKTDVEVYKRANISRQLFSKIRSNPHYRPSKPTVVAFAVALELSLDETRDLLDRAGYSLSPALEFDVIVWFYIANGKYDIYKINEALFKYDQQTLGDSAA